MFVKECFRIQDPGEFVRLFSSPRLDTYLGACSGDLERALHLHAWNAAVGAAFYVPLQHLEVAIRNAMDRELSQTMGPAWLDDPRLPSRSQQRVREARAMAGGSGRAPPDIIAALSFGFWVGLLQRQADPLWRLCLHRAFGHAKARRDEVHKRLDHLREFRNRIAHHEPIFGRHLAADLASILTVAGWISAQLRDWIAHHDHVTAVLAAKP